MHLCERVRRACETFGCIRRRLQHARPTLHFLACVCKKRTRNQNSEERRAGEKDEEEEEEEEGGVAKIG